MKDLTWDDIIQRFGYWCREMRALIEQDPEFSHEAQRTWIQSLEGQIAVIPKFREHPELVKRVPLTSHFCLVWFLNNHLQVRLYCEQNRISYIVWLYKKSVALDEKHVGFDEVVQTVWAYLDKAG
jgi:hypothetical protein